MLKYNCIIKWNIINFKNNFVYYVSHFVSFISSIGCVLLSSLFKLLVNVILWIDKSDKI